MKNRLIYLAFAGALALAPSVAMAQGAGGTSGTTSSGNASDPSADCTPERQRTGSCENPNNTFNMKLEEQQKFSAWVSQQSRADVAMPSGFSLQVGAILPPSVTYYEVPATVGIPTLTRYRYVQVGGKVVLVEPDTRRVVYVLN